MRTITEELRKKLAVDLSDYALSMKGDSEDKILTITISGHASKLVNDMCNLAGKDTDQVFRIHRMVVDLIIRGTTLAQKELYGDESINPG